MVINKAFSVPLCTIMCTIFVNMAGSNLFAQAYKYISFKSYNLRFLNLGIVPLSNDIEYRAHYANLALS